MFRLEVPGPRKCPECKEDMGVLGEVSVEVTCYFHWNKQTQSWEVDGEFLFESLTQLDEDSDFQIVWKGKPDYLCNSCGEQVT